MNKKHLAIAAALGLAWMAYNKHKDQARTQAAAAVSSVQASRM